MPTYRLHDGETTDNGHTEQLDGVINRTDTGVEHVEQHDNRDSDKQTGQSGNCNVELAVRAAGLGGGSLPCR